MKSAQFKHSRKTAYTLVLFFAVAGFYPRAWADSVYEAESSPLSHRFVGIRITPFEAAMLFDPSHGSSAHATLDLGLGHFVTVGPRVTFFRSKNSFHNDRSFGLGLEGAIYLNGARFENSWMFIPYLGVHSHMYQARDSFLDNSPMLSTHATTAHLGTWFGYQWHWMSGFNIRLAAGLDFDTVPRELPLKGPMGESGIAFTDGGLQGASEFTIGMIF